MTVAVTDISDAAYIVLKARLLDSKTPLHERFRALFTLKALKTERAIGIISAGFANNDSALLKHELAYCLGQIGNPLALPTLVSVLQDMSEDPMVRHEAAEAMGAISSPTSIPVLERGLNDADRSVRETCEIALAKIEWDQSEEGQRYRVEEISNEQPIYTSTDPAPPNLKSEMEVVALRSRLLDKQLPLFDRYRAMFALRNFGTAAAVEALADGFSDDSALFKHEIAFVFGQLLSAHAVPSLIKVLQNTKESEMVRHEAAEALGGIATPEVLPHLKEWMTREDSPRVVKESCQVAIDMWEYENSDQFQYADSLTKNISPDMLEDVHSIVS